MATFAVKGKEEAVPVRIAPLETARIEATLRFSTNLEAEREVRVLAQAPRQVKQLRVEEGDVVKRGQVLLHLQDEEQRSELARVSNQLTRAQQDYEQQRSLLEKGAVSDQDHQNAKFEVQRLKLLQADARRSVEYAVVRAPIGGTVTGRLVKLGDYVSLNQHLFDITDFNSIVARVFVPEKELRHLRVGLKARVVSLADPEKQHQGVIDRIAPQVDPRSGTVKVTIALPQNENLRPGMFVDVTLITAVHANALAIPKRALVYDNDEPAVFRVENQRAKRVVVRPLLEDREHVEPLAGFAVGDPIVVAGQAGLKDNALVEQLDDKPPKDPASSPTPAGATPALPSAQTP